MEITSLGHSAFRIKSKQGIVVMDPYEKSVGFSMPSTTADIVTISHDHPDHAAASLVKPSGERREVFVISKPGEYELSSVSIFGFASFHDAEEGKSRGKNTVFSVVIDGITIVHLGDLGHALSESFIEQLGDVDVLLCPVGGVYTIDSKTAVGLIQEIEPRYVIPMHYRTERHCADYSGLSTLADFQKEYGIVAEPVASLTLTESTLPDQTTLVVLQ